MSLRIASLYRLILIGATLSTLTACQRAPSAPTLIHFAMDGETMGTTYHIKLVVDGAAASAKASALQQDVDVALEAVNDAMSTYRPTSEISRFNGAAKDVAFPASDAFSLVTQKALSLHTTTNGAFDVTMGPLISLWGFDAAGRRTAPPSAAEILAAKDRMGVDKIVVTEGHLAKTHADVEINLSGIAKGYGVDVVHDVLVANGFTRFMVEIGGEVRTRGKNAEGNPWRIGINVPSSDADPSAVFRAVVVDDAAMATSGNYRNYFESNGQRYAHIIDPRTAAPVVTRVLSASVMAGDCTTADGLATAAMVLGPDAMSEVLARHPGTSALFIVEEGAGEAKTTRTLTVGAFSDVVADVADVAAK